MPYLCVDKIKTNTNNAKNSFKNRALLHNVVVKTKSVSNTESFVMANISDFPIKSFVFLYKIETKEKKYSIGRISQTKIKIENQKKSKKEGA